MLIGGGGADRVVGDQEWLSSRGANDRLDGGDDADLLIGDATNVYGNGKGGSDRLTGGAGNDILIGDGDVMKDGARGGRSEEHTSELQSLMRTSYAVFCL